MAEATTTELTNANTGILSRISGIFSNVRKLRSDPAVQKSIARPCRDASRWDGQATAPIAALSMW